VHDSRYRVPRFAERLGTSARFTRRLACERRIAFHKVGAYVRFDQDEVADWLASRRVEVRR
jgi:excisionase family DNA binding protein